MPVKQLKKMNLTGYKCSICGEEVESKTYQGIDNERTEPACQSCLTDDLDFTRQEFGEESYLKAVSEIKNYPLEDLPERYQLEGMDFESVLSDRGDEKRKYQN